MQSINSEKTIILLNAVSIFPLITVLSSMKMVLSQTFNIGMKYNTIVAYAGIISASRFLFISIVRDKSLPFFSSEIENYRKWAFLGSLIMGISLSLIYLVLISGLIKNPLTLVLIITLLSTVTVAAEGIYDAAISIFYSNYPDKETLSSSIFFGHKIAAFLGYFLFPFAVNYIGIHIPFISFIAISFGLCTTVFKLPAIPIIQKKTEKKEGALEVLQNIFLDIKNTPGIGKILLLITTCQFAILTINGIKCNFIAQVTSSPLLAYLLRGLSIVVGMLGGYCTNLMKKKVSTGEILDPKEKTNRDMNIFIFCGLLHLLSVLINYLSLTSRTPGIMIFSVIFENLSKGFLMYSLTNFFLLQSKNKPHLLTFFWGYFQIVRSVASGMSGYLFAEAGLNGFFLLLLLLCFPPIIIPFSMKK